jgi:hypothetical protein
MLIVLAGNQATISNHQDAAAFKFNMMIKERISDVFEHVIFIPFPLSEYILVSQIL